MICGGVKYQSCLPTSYVSLTSLTRTHSHCFLKKVKISKSFKALGFTTGRAIDNVKISPSLEWMYVPKCACKAQIFIKDLLFFHWLFIVKLIMCFFGKQFGARHNQITLSKSNIVFHYIILRKQYFLLRNL